MQKRYERAWAMMPEAAAEKAANLIFVPRFFENGDIAAKVEAIEGGRKAWSFRRFDGATGDHRPLFDHGALAAALGQEAHRLDITLEKAEEGQITFTSGKKRFRWDGAALIPADTQGLSLSPDGRLAVLLRDHNLWLREMETGRETQISADGQPHFDYASEMEGDTGFIARRLAGIVHRPNVLWSPDGSRFVTYRLDQREVPQLHLLQSVTGEVGDRPRLHSYRFSMPGDEILATAGLWVYTVATGSFIPLEVPPMAASLTTPVSPLGATVAWSGEGKYLIAYNLSRDFQTVTVYRINPETGGSTLLFEEKTDSFHFFDFFYMMQNGNEENPGETPAPLWYDDGEEELLWLSQRDGRYHLYAYDGLTGRLRRQVTSGDFDICRVHRIDREAGMLYASVLGLQADPYDHSLVRLPLAGGAPQTLSPEAGNHLITFAPGGGHYVDVCTESDLPPVITLRSREGGEIAPLAQSDISRLEEAGFVRPIRFTATASDGKTPLYGVLLLPDAPPGRKVPLVEYYYGGVQTAVVPHSLHAMIGSGFMESLVQLGMAVMVVDGMGTPLRGKAFHDHCHRNLGGCAGLEDHVAVIGQLCERYPQLDRSRVGVWGHSGGGYATLHCLTRYPQVYKCGVSSGGNHVQEIYLADWSERFMGRYDPGLWLEQIAPAERLEGKLLLIHGELDDNVHPANTMRVVDALIKADKDFELLIMPNLHHALRPSRYFQRRILDFFVNTLPL